MITNWGELLSYVFRHLGRRTYERFLLDSPRDHAPDWHQFGLCGHMYAVYAEAIRLKRETGYDVVVPALYHDIGKIRAFAKAVVLADLGLDPAPSYHAHENVSAHIATRHGLPGIDSRVIDTHAWAYQTISAQKVVSKLRHNPETVVRWIALCSCDAVGKGFLENQRRERPIIARKLREVAKLVGLDKSLPRLINTCVEAVERQPAQTQTSTQILVGGRT